MSMVSFRSYALLSCLLSVSFGESRYAVTDMQTVAGTSHESTVELCEEKLAGQSVGVDWGNGNNDRVLELCIHRKRIDTLNVTSPFTSVVQRIGIRSNGCLPTEERLHQPNGDVVVCIRRIPISQEIITSGIYLSDVWVSKNRHHTSDLPGWSHLTKSVEESPYSVFRRAWQWLWKKSFEGAFITFQRPLLPIREVKLVTTSISNDTAEACIGMLGAAWEVAGNAALEVISDSDQKAVLCMRRQAVQSSDTNPKMLTDITIVESQPCDTDSTRLALPSSNRSICLVWSAQPPNGTFLVDLRLEQASKDFDLGQFERVSQLNLNDGGSNTIHLYKQSSWSSLDLAQEDEDENRLLNKPPLLARIVTNASEAITSATASGLGFNTLQLPLSDLNETSSQSRLSFKVLQFADLHYSGDPTTSCDDAPNGVKDCNEALMTEFVNELLDVEKPDFVVFSGDNVQVFKKSLRQKAIDAVTVGVEARGIPFAVIFGNHDDEKNFPRRDQMRMYVKKPLAYARSGPKNIDGVGNYELSVQAPVDGPWGSAGRTVFRMYFVDSHAYPDKRHGVRDYVSKYDWIKPSQVAYYRQLSQNHSANNDSVPAIMFFHIPLPEYAMETKYLRSKGDRKDEVLSSQVNTNLFSSLVELGEVKATFCGHDHLNDFCFKRDGVQLCYGGGIGMGTAYGDSDIPRRARVIEWSVDGENHRTIRSWRRLYGEVEKKQLEEVLYEGRHPSE